MSATTEVPAFVAELDQVRDGMRGKGRPALLKIIRQGFVFIREELLKVSCALVEAESRGDSVKPDEVGCERWFIDMARLIGSGRLVVDVAMRFGGRGHTFDSLKAMSPEKQAELLEEKTDDEIEAEFRKPATTRRPATPRHRQDDEGRERTNGNGDHASVTLTPEDAVKRALEIISACSDPATAAEGLLHRLPPFLRGMA